MTETFTIPAFRNCRIRVFPTREAWLEGRAKNIGSSDAPAIIGVCPFSSPLAKWTEKVHGKEETGTNFTAAGQYLESAIARWLSDTLGARAKVTLFGDYIPTELRKNGGTFPVCYMKSEERITATPDAILDWPTDEAEALTGDGRNGGLWLVEIKNTSVFQADKWENGVPPNVRAQVQHQMMVTGVRRCVVAVLIGGNDLRWFLVHANEEYQSQLLAFHQDFIRAIDEEDPPPAQSDSDIEYLAALYGEDQIRGKVIDLDADVADADEQRVHHEAQAKFHKDLAAQAKGKIIEAMKGAEEGKLPDGTRYTFKFTTRQGYTKEVKPWKGRILRRIKKRD